MAGSISLISSSGARRCIGWLLVLIGVFLSSGCGKRFTVEELDTTQKWKLVDLPGPRYALEPELRILIWHNYIPDEVIRHFEVTYGVKVTVEYFSENEELPARLAQTDKNYDVVMPGTYMVQQLIRQKMLRPIERAHIPNLRHVDARYFDMKHDVALRYSVPFYHSTAGVALNVKYTSGLPLTWPEFAEETGNQLVRGRVAMLDEMRTAFGTALLMVGCSPNTRNPADIARARDMLMLTKSQDGLTVDLDGMPRLLANEDAIIAISWSGDAGRAMARNGYVRFLVPRGLSISELDSFCIPATAKHPKTAEFFINFLLTPEIAAALTNYSYYANTCSASRAFVSAAILNGPGYMVPLQHDAVFLEDVGDAGDLYRAAWKAVKDAPAPDIDKVPLPTPRTLPALSQ